MALHYIITTLVLALLTVLGSPLPVSQQNITRREQLENVNKTIIERLHQLLDTIHIVEDVRRTPRTFGGLPGTSLTVGALDLAIQALGGEG